MLNQFLSDIKKASSDEGVYSNDVSEDNLDLCPVCGEVLAPITEYFDDEMEDIGQKCLNQNCDYKEMY